MSDQDRNYRNRNYSCRLCVFLWRRRSVSTQSALGGASPSLGSHTHAPSAGSCVCFFACSSSRQFTSVNMCGNPRAQLLRAFYWLSSRLWRTPLADASSQWSLYYTLIGRWPGHSRFGPLMCCSCVQSRAGLLYYGVRVCKHTYAIRRLPERRAICHIQGSPVLTIWIW